MAGLAGQLDIALQQCADNPPSVALYAALAQAQQQAGQSEAALRSYMLATLLQAAQLVPLDGRNWMQLGLAFHQQGREDYAWAAFRAALLVQPLMAEAYNNLGSLSQGEFALTQQRRALRLVPHHAAFHSNLAHALLGLGHWQEGFREWEWRTPSPPRDFTAPRWQGQDFAGQTLLVHAEQGYGDSLQFARFLPLVIARGGRVILESRQPQIALLQRIAGLADIIAWGDELPPFDWQISLPSLASLFPPPPPSPYLSADPEKSRKWREILAEARPKGRGRRIGLVWAGNPRGHDPRRAIDYQMIAKLVASLPDDHFVGLQRELTGLETEFPQLGAQIDDFDALAAVMVELDLVISVDTAAAHLAGALGREVIVLLHHAADWRWWGAAEDTSFWYPSARLYRQRRQGDWLDVIERLAGDLRGGVIGM